MVVRLVLGLIPVVAQVASDEHRQAIGRRHARCRMTGARAGAGPDRIDPQLPGELRHRGEVGGRERRAGGGHGLVLGGRCARRVCAGRIRGNRMPGGRQHAPTLSRCAFGIDGLVGRRATHGARASARGHDGRCVRAVTPRPQPGCRYASNRSSQDLTKLRAPQTGASRPARRHRRPRIRTPPT